MAKENPNTNAEKNKNTEQQEESNPKAKVPILSYMVIFIASAIITIMISTIYFSNLRKKQIEFMERLSAENSGESVVATKEHTPEIDTIITNTETEEYPLEVAEKDTIVDSSSTIPSPIIPNSIESGIGDTVVIAPIENIWEEVQPEDELTESQKAVNINKTLKIIKSMKTSQAVELISQFDDATVLLFLSKMRERNAAKILAALPAERAFKLTQMMLEGS